ncbi:ABC1 domain containing protein [Moelleriella libera RCEF 2490]|uniref:ABC1 domain containing protein n=1 Tax=Moelleriella libera RCEF 2490 TaxID=1081109 RepID=A0A167Z2J6_9HYPO|nr:ABC1 domain containing protein [Moelleriella libera RCEF 2490]
MSALPQDAETPLRKLVGTSGGGELVTADGPQTPPSPSSTATKGFTHPSSTGTSKSGTKSRSKIQLIANPLIKQRNLTWTVHPPPSSSPTPPPPPPPRPHSRPASTPPPPPASVADPYLSARCFPSPSPQSLLSREACHRLYNSCLASSAGAHFVIHQHDHPIAGPHYDLRLQINPTSSASWAIMYGPPGDPNSARLNRNATETRIHCLWNHVVETASRDTGSLLIWDTGTYSVLQHPSSFPSSTIIPSSLPSSSSSASSHLEKETAWPPATPLVRPAKPTSNNNNDQPSQQDLLREAFHSRKIRIQLHGAKLPPNYVLNLRLTKTEYARARARKPDLVIKKRRPRKRRRLGAAAAPPAPDPDSTGRDSDSPDEYLFPKEEGEGEGAADLDGEAAAGQQQQQQQHLSPSERELRELEDAEIRRTNAYPGATNSIGSIHQRKWYLSLDREASGFVRRRQGSKVRWEPSQAQAQAASEPDAPVNDDGPEAHMERLSFPFYVRGVEHERSVMTGRRASDILRDEGVQDFRPRQGWKAVLN